MKAPPGLVGAALLLWGLSLGMPWLAAVAALGFEALRAMSAANAAERLAVSTVRICALLMIAFLAYALTMQRLPQSLYGWLRWMPLVLMPVAALQVLGARLTFGTFSRALGVERDAAAPDEELDFTHAYAAIALAAAGTGSAAHAWLYAGFAALAAWALLARVPRARRAIAALMIVVAAGIGYGTHVGISALQGQVEEWSTELIADLMAGKPDPFRERTRIGDLGKIKLSDRIVMRVAVEGRRPAELLLRETAFDRYRNGEWQAAKRTARTLAQQPGDRWVVSDGAASSRLTLRRSLPGGEGLLPLPMGTRTVEGLPAEKLEAFPSGAVRATGTPRFVSMAVAYDPAAEDAPPADSDLEVPPILAPLLAKVVQDEGLRARSAAATVEALHGFFQAKFAYSLDLGERRGGRTIADFLLRERKGHCEYFATATVLLLRQAGIPARYVGGFSAQEYSSREKAYVVRARHAHAWALAYVDGRWVNVDTTPARWADFEGEAARSSLAPLLDTMSWIVDRIIQAWVTTPPEQLGTAAAALLAFLGLAVWSLRSWKRRRSRPPSPGESDAAALAWKRLEGRLAAVGHGRLPNETARAWIGRLRSERPEEPAWAALAQLARAYYRVRFDPASTPEAARAFVAAADAAPAPPASR